VFLSKSDKNLLLRKMNSEHDFEVMCKLTLSPLSSICRLMAFSKKSFL